MMLHCHDCDFLVVALPLTLTGFVFLVIVFPAAAAAAEARSAAMGNGAAEGSVSRAPVGLKAKPGKWSKSKKLQAGAFQGSGNKMV